MAKFRLFKLDGFAFTLTILCLFLSSTILPSEAANKLRAYPPPDGQYHPKEDYAPRLIDFYESQAGVDFELMLELNHKVKEAKPLTDAEYASLLEINKKITEALQAYSAAPYKD